MNHRTLRRLNAALFLTLATSSLQSVAGEVQYHWKNAQGEAVYSDQPPPAGTDYQVVDTHPGLNYVEPDAPGPDASGEDAAGGSAGDASGSAENVDSQKNAALCEKARMNLIALEHQRGLIALLASSVNAADGNIEKISMDERDGRISVVQLVVSVHDRVHLARVIKKLRALKGVVRITRVRA